mmetsp:Transcript_128842/g.400915  ORF Transcript_128842/g.400915 Transcript_128842/m.400915 type:complete len:280 (-) Transcript_128842:709-1548(-)
MASRNLVVIRCGRGGGSGNAPLPSVWCQVPQTRVDQASVRGEELLLGRLALVHGDLELALGAVVEVGAAAGVDGRLPTGEYKVAGGHALAADAAADCRPLVVVAVAVEVPAMSVLVGLCAHGDPCVDILALLGLAPPVHLHLHPVRELHVHNVERLADPAVLHDLANVVVLNVDGRIYIVPLESQVGEAVLDAGGVPSDVVHPNDKFVAAHARTADANVLGHRQPVGHPRGQVLALDPDGVALDDPVLARGVVVSPNSVKRPHVRITEDQARLQLRRRR